MISTFEFKPGPRTAIDLERIVNMMLDVERIRLSVDPPDPPKSRAYKCKQENCDRAAYARGWCNAHYIRNRLGRDMGGILYNRTGGKTCVQCGKTLDGKGAYGFCANHYKKLKSNTIKLALISAFGGKCLHCGNVYPAAAFDFHHLGNKEHSISRLINDGPVKQICLEVSKCVLLCANCHRIEHANES